jgi:hypothetical protein
MPRLYVGFLFCAMIVVGVGIPRFTREEKRLILCAKILVKTEGSLVTLGSKDVFSVQDPRIDRDPSLHSGLEKKTKRRVREGATSQTRLLSKRTAFGYPMAALLVSRDANPLITFASGLLEG